MKRTSIVWLILVQFVLAFEWLHSGWGKWSAPAFMDGIGATLMNFAAKTPYAWYADFLRSTAVPNAQLFGTLIRTGELAVGIALALGGLLLLAQKRVSPGIGWLLVAANLGGALMNLNFYLASGAMSPSGAGINLVMMLIHLVLAGFYVSSRRQLAS
jgi:hypothetical protein